MDVSSPSVIKPILLKREVLPYIPLIVIAAIISIANIFLYLEQHIAIPFYAIIFVWLLVLGNHYFLWVYRIGILPEGILQKSSGSKPMFIAYQDIKKITYEVQLPIHGDGRPFRRIAIYGKVTVYGSQKRTVRQYIDVSLKHFTLSGVRMLLRNIHEARPDVIMPDVVIREKKYPLL